MTKQCECLSTSSGPRTITSSCIDDKTQTMTIMTRRVQLACNACNTPWKEEDIKKFRITMTFEYEVSDYDLQEIYGQSSEDVDGWNTALAIAVKVARDDPESIVSSKLVNVSGEIIDT